MAKHTKEGAPSRVRELLTSLRPPKPVDELHDAYRAELASFWRRGDDGPVAA